MKTWNSVLTIVVKKSIFSGEMLINLEQNAKVIVFFNIKILCPTAFSATVNTMVIPPKKIPRFDSKNSSNSI